MTTEISVLAELDHIRKRPGMYIGETQNPTHLLKEVLDNSLDELLNNFASVISIYFDNNGNVCVIDNGRGFPIHDVTLPNGQTENSVIAAVCRLFSGAKFNDATYDMSKGTHGVGLSAVNALSTFLTMTIKDRVVKNKVHIYRFKMGKLDSHEIIEQDINFSTKLEFQADKTYFETLNIDVEKIKKELFLICAKYPKSKIYLNNKQIPNGTMEDYFRWICGVQKETPVFNVYYVSPIKEEMLVYFTYENGNATPCGDVNLGPCEGNYITSFATMFYNSAKDIINDQVTRSEILNGLRYYVSLRIKEPKYDSQNKTKMVKNISSFNYYVKKELNVKLTNSFFTNYFEEILKFKKGKIASKVLKTNRKRVSTENPIKDCEQTPGEILYILEGDSAEGTLKEVRNARTDAIFPVNGKILNTINTDIDKAVTIKKIKYLLEALGVNPTNSNSNSFRYKKVKVICDADPDGLHISVLVSILIWKYCHQLITEQRFSIIIPPLYGVSKNKTFIPVYNQNELAKYSNSGYDIKRFKGLGEMNARELDVIIQNPVEYIATLPSSDKEKSLIFEIMSKNSESKKQLCNDLRFTLTNLTKSMRPKNVQSV